MSMENIKGSISKTETSSENHELITIPAIRWIQLFIDFSDRLN